MGGFQLARQTFEMPKSNQAGPLEQYAQLQQLKSQQQAQQLQAGQLQIQQQQMQDQQAMTKAMQQWDGKSMDDLPGLIMKNKGSAQAVLGLKQHIIQQNKDLAETFASNQKGAKDQVDAIKTKGDQISGGLNGVLGLPPEQMAQGLAQWTQDSLQNGLIDQPHAQQFAQLAQAGDPEKIKFGIQTAQKMATAASAQAENALKNSQLQQSQAETTAIPQRIAETQRHNAVEEGQGGDRLKLERARLSEERRHNQATEGSLTSDALTMAAEQYAKTGVMPSVGRTAGIRSQIMNEAARVYPQIDVATNAAAYKANEDSLKKLTSQRDSVVAFENTAGKNLDLFLQTAKKVVDFGSPLVNKPMRDAARLAGSADQAAYNAARQVATNEIAKVTSNPTLAGSLSDSARHEVDAYNPGSATLAQTFKVAQILRQDMANRHQSYDDQINDIQKRIGAKPGQTQPQSTSSQPAAEVTATGPNGHKITVRNGKWVDAATGQPIQ